MVVKERTQKAGVQSPAPHFPSYVVMEKLQNLLFILVSDL